MDLLNSEVKSKQQCYTEGQMELYDIENSQDAAPVFSKLLFVLGSPLGDIWRIQRSTALETSLTTLLCCKAIHLFW